ncbi:hypothetical protein PM082_010625 [Marasmius tenuissimus]|nr:hypothetical protein PM082_010625 [Marasmius tenuissimus]
MQLQEILVMGAYWQPYETPQFAAAAGKLAAHTMSFREATVVIIETSRTAIRAGLGLHELLKTPSVEIQARVGLRKNAANGELEAKPMENGEGSISTFEQSNIVTSTTLLSQLERSRKRLSR